MTLPIMIGSFWRFFKRVSFCLIILLSCCAEIAKAQSAPAVVVSTSPISLDRTVPKIPKVESLPGGDSGVVIYSSARWKILRRVPSGYLAIYESEGRMGWRPVDVALEWRRNTYPMLAMETSQGLFFVGYDKINNLPSGRRQGLKREGFDLYLINNATKGFPERIVENMKLGGIDTLLYGVARKNQIHLCGASACLTVALGINGRVNVKSWELDALEHFDIVELIFRQGDAIALIRKHTIENPALSSPIPDQPYLLAVLTPTSVSTLPLPTESGIPFGLEWKANSVVIRLAKHQADYQNVIRYDLGRMPFSGVMDFGSNNLEGRVAWSQAYYLNGLVSLLQTHAAADKHLRSSVRSRIVAEVELLRRLVGAPYPGMASSRYSIDREPIIFALHLGRTLSLLANCRLAGITGLRLKQAEFLLQKQLLDLDVTVETLALPNPLDEKQSTLIYRRGSPFWADGVNVPNNYNSGYVLGLLASGNRDGIRRARQIERSILRSEFDKKLPVIWRYWSGLGDKGWQEISGVSLNTPSWSGNGGAPAHISYRTMDAEALVRLHTAVPDAVSSGLIDHFASLASRGWLLPFINQSLRDDGRSQPLQPAVIRYYGRSSAAWEIQSQVAALREGF